MELNPDDLEIMGHPAPSSQGGMTTGQIPAGIKVVHKPTGCEVACTLQRSQRKNREAALIALQIMIEDGQRPNT